MMILIGKPASALAIIINVHHDHHSPTPRADIMGMRITCFEPHSDLEVIEGTLNKVSGGHHNNTACMMAAAVAPPSACAFMAPRV